MAILKKEVEQAFVKNILVAKDTNVFQIKTIKQKFVNQLERWQSDNKIDKDWCEVLGYYNNLTGIKSWKMVVFKYKGRLYHIEHFTFFYCMGYDTNNINILNSVVENEFSKFPQLFVE